MSVSLDVFNRDAADAGFKVTHNPVYRLDGRDPKTVRSAGGLQPNPAKPDLSMAEHVAPGCTGGSRYVSTSVLAGNAYNIRNTDFILAHKLRGPSDEEALAWANDGPRPKASLYRVFEYEMKGVIAAVVTQGGVEGEKEALICGAKPAQITRVRQVFLRQAPVQIWSNDYECWSNRWVNIRDASIRIGSWHAFADASR